MNGLTIGTIFYGITDQNETTKHYKIVYNIIRDKIQFVSVTTSYLDGTLLEISPSDIDGNNTVKGFINTQLIGQLSTLEIETLLSENMIVLKPYRASDALIRKIQNILDSNEQLRQENKELEDENLLWKSATLIGGVALLGLGIKAMLDNNDKNNKR